MHFGFRRVYEIKLDCLAILNVIDFVQNITYDDGTVGISPRFRIQSKTHPSRKPHLYKVWFLHYSNFVSHILYCYADLNDKINYVLYESKIKNMYHQEAKKSDEL